MTGKGIPLKDQLFNARKVAWLAGRFPAPFDAHGFERDVMARLGELELKARIDWIADCLLSHLPKEFERLDRAIRAALPPPLDPDLGDDDFGDFIFAPLGEVAVKAGLEDHPEQSLSLIEDLTQRFSMEWALRPFLKRWPELTMERLARWQIHPNYHVRRLVSEGTRPRLPWGIGIGLAPGAALPLLDTLYADRTRYVTRSVANHLNDIAKSDPCAVLHRLETWREEGRQSPAELDWITRQALRGLVKAGEPRALRHLGFDPEAKLRAELRVRPRRLKDGGTLHIEIDLSGPPGQPVLVDYVLTLYRPKGQPGAKVFKLRQGRLGADGRLRLTKSQRVRSGLSTYRLHPGPQRVAVQVNGVRRAEADFEITP